MPVIRHRPTTALRRFGRAEDGVTAVEFSLIAFPFFAMLFAVFELALSFLVATTLEAAVGTAAREIRTGQFQATANTPRATSVDDFKGKVCAQLAWLGPEATCKARLAVNSRTYASFPIMRDELARPGGLNGADGACWSLGGARTIVLVNVSYRWRVITPMLREMMGHTPDGHQTMTAMAVFRNEPFGAPTPAGALCS